VDEVCRKARCQPGDLPRWKKAYGGLLPSEGAQAEASEEEEIARLRKLVAHLTVGKRCLVKSLRSYDAAPSSAIVATSPMAEASS
jgi:Transposase